MSSDLGVAAGDPADAAASARECPAWLADLNLWTDAELHADPYSRYAELRKCPMGRSEKLGGFWVAASYADVLAVLQDAESFSNEVLFVPPTKDPSGRRIPIELDPPEHGPYKQMLGRWFSPQRVRQWEDAARSHMRELLASTEGRDEIEFVREIAVPLPFRVMGDVFGLRPEDVRMLRQWDEEGMRAGTNDLEARKAATRSTRVRMLEFFGDLAASKTAESGPASGMIDELARVRLNEVPLTRAEMANICVTMWNASLHTTSNVLANSIYHLAGRPDLQARLRSDPASIPGAIEELMRYESIVSQARVVVRDVTIAGRQLSAGDYVVTLTGSAGRDESVYAEPDQIEFDRPDKRHLMFGAGLHRCIGAHLARMELRVAFEEIHAAWPAYAVDARKPIRRHTGLERGTDELWLILSRAS
jgi:cytochrome P450